jgi:hypothetical protein
LEAWNNSFPISMANWKYRNAKSPAFLRRPGFRLATYDLRRNQPRVRERIMKLS